MYVTFVETWTLKQAKNYVHNIGGDMNAQIGK